MEKKKILIVDDEVSFTNLVKLILETTDEFEVMVENSGERAVSVAKEFNPALILLDVIMPRISGMDVAAQLRDSEQTKDIPVVFLTAIVSEKEVKSKEGNIGGKVFIAKPIAAGDLIECIRKNARK